MRSQLSNYFILSATVTAETRREHSYMFAIRGRAAGQGRVFSSTGLRKGIEFKIIRLE